MFCKNIQKIAVMCFIFFVSTGCMADVMKCNYTVYYFSIDAEFYVPPTPEEIKLHGTKLDNKKCQHMCSLIENININSNRKKVVDEDKALRIEVENHVEKSVFFITSEYKIVMNGLVYDVPEVLVKNAVNEIQKHGKNKK